MKVEVDVLDSPSPNKPTVSVDVKATLQQLTHVFTAGVNTDSLLTGKAEFGFTVIY